MAIDATGPVTSPDNIPTLATSADIPTGKGINAMMAAIQTALTARMSVKSATTVAGLGTGTSGQSGVVRTSLGDIVPVVYDGVSGKWVSPPFAVMSGFNSWNSTDLVLTETRWTFGSAGQVGVAETAIRWKPFSDAGLRLQFRVTGRLYGTASGLPASTQAFVAVNEVNISNNASTVATSQVAGSLVDIAGATSSTFVGVDSGWSSSAPVPTKDIALVDLTFLAGSAETIRFIGSVMGRWVG